MRPAPEATRAAYDFATIFADYSAYVLGLLQRLGVSGADVEDVAQEVFLTVHQKLPSFEGRSCVKTWICGICLRRTLAYRRSRARYSARAAAAVSGEPEMSWEAEDHFAARERVLLLHRGLDGLSPEQRAVFVLYEIEQLPMNEVAFTQQHDAGGPCGGGFHYTQGIQLPEGARAELSCTYARARGAGEQAAAVPLEQCARSANALAVDMSIGQACTPAPVPADGFRYSVVSIDTAANGCGGGPCMIYRLDGNPPPTCSDTTGPQCADAQALAERVYCTCRCDLPDGEPGPRCACPSGFSCVPTFDAGPLAGSYCVRSETLLGDP